MGEGALRARDIGLAARRLARPQHLHNFNKRQGGVDGQCGPAAGGASCAAGYCCSGSGWCGKGKEYCAAPDCLFNYGSGCDANSIPNGDDTRNLPRPQLGSVEYGGEGIYPCKQPGTIAITYDDGPYIYTNDVLDSFAKYGFKATFFVTGNNNGKGAIDDASTPWPAVITRMVNEGHQVASHTWSHQDLSAITHEQRVDQMVNNEKAIRNIIQKFPTYMRPPYSSCSKDSGCQKDMKDLGYVVTYFDLDTSDYLNTEPDKIQNAKDKFASSVQNSNSKTDKFLGIAHDIHQQTALNLTAYMLQIMSSKGYRGVTVGECLGEPEANWYRASSGKIVTSSSAKPSATQSSGTVSSAAPTATPTGTSQDGTCGASKGLTCKGWEGASTYGECCSPAGWCGSTPAHCGDGCQGSFGICGNSNS
ncbi:carbohydrate esterase family 4 protein, partial [Periconia macrospinosa]